MRYYTIVFPGEWGQHVQETWSEKQILDSYYPYWCQRMKEVGKDPSNYIHEHCIEDWKTIHWAEETDEWGNKCS